MSSAERNARAIAGLKSQESYRKKFEAAVMAKFKRAFDDPFKDYKGKGIDGIIYSSSKDSSGKNLVLFCNQADSSEYVELAGPIELYTKKWTKVNEWK